jgi:hypothetical protein
MEPVLQDAKDGQIEWLDEMSRMGREDPADNTMLCEECRHTLIGVRRVAVPKNDRLEERPVGTALFWWKEGVALLIDERNNDLLDDLDHSLRVCPTLVLAKACKGIPERLVFYVRQVEGETWRDDLFLLQQRDRVLEPLR